MYAAPGAESRSIAHAVAEVADYLPTLWRCRMGVLLMAALAWAEDEQVRVLVSEFQARKSEA